MLEYLDLSARSMFCCINRIVIVVCTAHYGPVAEWLECLTAERIIDGSSPNVELWQGCSLTVYPVANGYLVEAAGKLMEARKGTGHPTSTSQRLRTSVLSNRYYPMCGVVYGIFKLNLRTMLIASGEGCRGGYGEELCR